MQKQKLTEEEMKKISDFRETVSKLTVEVGDLELNKVLLKNALEETEKEYEKLINQFKQLKQSEKTFIMELKKKYGEGQILLSSGEFIKTN